MLNNITNNYQFEEKRTHHDTSYEEACKTDTCHISNLHQQNKTKLHYLHKIDR